MSEDLREIVTDLQSALTQARELSWAARGWERLNGGESSSIYGPAPHGDEAREAFASGLEMLGDEPALLHHLAVAEHALAWDLELAGSPQAADAWRRALGTWRRLHGCPEFWQAMRERAAELQPPVDPAVVDEIRGELYDELLAIHVALVRHYCDLGETERARTHVEFIRYTRLPPAVFNQMPDLLYEAMTGSLSDLVASQEYDQAAAAIERYLEFYPDNLGALQTVAEVFRDWARLTSVADDWPTIVEIARRADGWARRLEEHEALDEAPLASLALTQLGATLGRRFYRKLDQVFGGDPEATGSVVPEHLSWCNQAVRWAELAHGRDPAREYLLMLCASLYMRARCATALGDTAQGLSDFRRHMQLRRLIEGEEQSE